MVRLVRVLRLLRVVRFCSDLRIMVNGILGSAEPVWRGGEEGKRRESLAMRKKGASIGLKMGDLDGFVGEYIYYAVMKIGTIS